jgi:alpha-L-fucosidase
MKKALIFLLASFIFIYANAQRVTDMGVSQQPDSVMQWFKNAKFGMFIHWGIYSVYGQGEWYWYNDSLSEKDYYKAAYPYNGNYFDADQYDPSRWVKIARDAGMKYMVMTTRHHDGFALFDSRFPNSVTSQQTLDRDLVREYVNACRKAGMRVGFYYSVLSWRFPGYFDPSGTDAKPNHFGIKTAAWHKHNALVMKEELYTQVKELMTQYGQIDDLWWDGGWLSLQGHDRTAAYFWEPGKYRDPKNAWAGDYGTSAMGPNADGRYLGIMGMVRKYQPHILANSRSGWIGDYANEEGYATIKGPIRKEYWEKTFSLNKTAWGYTFKQDLLTAGQVIDYLVNAVVRNGNLLLNVGPDQHGVIPSGQVKILEEVGAWLHKYGESIYGTRSGPWNPVDGQYGFTFKKNILFVHILRGYKGNDFTLPHLDNNTVVSCRDLGSKAKLPFSVNPDGTISIKNINRSRSKYDTVIEVVCKNQVKKQGVQ